jgi:hypothetical protein
MMIALAFDRQRLRIAIKHLVDLLDEGVGHKAIIKSLSYEPIMVELIDRADWLKRIDADRVAEMSDE